jgi:hypothetical protein
MKQFIPVFFIIIPMIMFFSFQIISCTKTNTITNTVTVTDTVTKIQKDTLVIKDTALTTAILTANSWKVSEIAGLVNNSYVNYTRGGSGNTLALDNEYITFNAIGSGTYTVSPGNSNSFTWNFTDATNSTIIWNLNTAVPATIVTWTNVVYKNASISYTESYTTSGSNELASGTRIPR